MDSADRTSSGLNGFSVVQPETRRAHKNCPAAMQTSYDFFPSQPQLCPDNPDERHMVLCPAMAAHLRPAELSAANAVVDLPPCPQCDNNDTRDELFHDMFSYTPVPTLLLNADLRVAHVSESYCHVAGVSDREQLLGCHIDDLCDKVPVPSRALATEGIRTARDSASPSSLDESLGGAIWTLRTVPVVRNGEARCFLMELQDNTEARRHQLELEERLYANETFKILVETVRDYAIFMLDPQGNVATWNAGAESFKGYRKSEIIGKHFSNFYSQEDRDNDKPGRELRDALRDGRCEDEGWRYRKDGSRFWSVRSRCSLGPYARS